MKYIIFKRLLDIVLAFILLLISLPLILFFAICTRIFIGRKNKNGRSNTRTYNKTSHQPPLAAIISEFQWTAHGSFHGLPA